MNKQITLLSPDQTYREIKKHSSMVQMNNITTAQERKSLNALIRVAKDILKREPEKRVFTCDIWVIKRLAGMQRTNNITLKEALENLSHTSVKYNIFGKDDAHERGVFNLLAMAKIKAEWRGKPTTITFEFPSLVLDMIKHPNMYVRLNLLAIRDLKSKHSIALYEFLQDYVKLWKYSCTTEDFRLLMGIKEGQYRIFTLMQKRVLDVAVKEINAKTDITVSYETERYGRKISHIHFTMWPKTEALPTEQAQDSVRAKLKSFGISEKKIEALILNHDEQYLQANIAIVEEQAEKGKINNIAAYLLRAFQDDYRQQETEYSKQKKAREAAKEQAKIEQATAEQVEEEKRKQFLQERKIRLDAIKEKLTDTETQQLKAEFEAEIMETDFFSQIYKTKGFEHGVIQQQRDSFLVGRFDDFEGSILE